MRAVPLIAEGTNSIVNAPKVLIYRVVKGIGAVCQPIGLLVEFANEGLLVYRGSYISLCSTVGRAIATVATKTVSAPTE